MSDDWVIRHARGRHSLSREHSVTSQRVQLLDAMAKCVAENGYPATAAEDVAARALVPVETFYEHFADTEACFLAAYDLGMGVLGAAVSDGIGSPDRPPLARFEGLLCSYLDLLADEPAFARTFLIEVYAAGPRALQRRLEALRNFALLIGEIFEPAPGERGGLDPFACEALVGAVSSIVMTRVAAARFDQLAELREPILDLVQRLLQRSYAASE
jgi:AcrR family transcriptional regulator